ncbi:MAG: protein kinase [Lentisphaeria bacterium]|nr:protein kinase [Lentisphaeria bacterium]
MTSDSNRNFSPVTGVDSSQQARKRVRYVLPKGCIIGGSYCIEKPLGHGGMGEVYLARHMKLDIYRAIKILLPKIAVKNPMFATRFMREAKLAIQLQHPNIINVMDADYDERLSIYYIVMEYVDGGTVRNLIRKNGPMDEREVLKIVLRVGEALAVGEERKIVHRDIKPDNIMLTRENVVKLADLGIAKDAADSAGDSLETAPEVLIGTPAYVSPEQAKDAQRVDSRADIYSLGVSMYEMLTGEKPYKGKSTVEILQQLFSAPVPEVRPKCPAVSRKVSDLVYRMMAKEKEKRPRNWKIFCREVAKLLGEEAVSGVNETATTSVEDLKGLLAGKGGIVLGGEENKPFIDWKKIKKIAKYSVVGVLGFVLCFLLVGGVLSPNNLAAMRDAAALMLIGEKYREQCEKYQLSPPLYLVLSSGILKQAWIDQNKPGETLGKAQDIRTEETAAPIQNAEYNGRGTLKFELAASPEVENWLQEKQYKMEVSADHVGRIRVAVPGELAVPGGRYALHMEIPECKPFKDAEIDLKNDAVQTLKVFVQPLDAMLKIDCNVPGFQVWQNNTWVETRELQTASLRNVDLVIRADGYKLFTKSVKLQPGEVRSVSVVLSPLLRKNHDSGELRQADREFEMKNYATAKKLYKREADAGNPAAMYKLGVIYEQGLGEWFADKNRAFQYFRMAADMEHPEAIFKVGEFYENGLGSTPKDEKQALSWFKRGVELGHVPSLVKIGLFHENGQGGLARDTESALTCYLRCADKGNAEAQYRAARIYEQKMLAETRQNKRDEYKKLAKRFYEEASGRNWADARSRLRAL